MGGCSGGGTAKDSYRRFQSFFGDGPRDMPYEFPY
jgi:hypothetical protein